MALEGTFKDFHIADIVQLIGLQRKTGRLTLEGEEDTLAITFEDGTVTWAQSTRVPWERRMAQLLVARGLLKPAQLQEVLSKQEESQKKLSAILTEAGLVKKKDWDDTLAREVEEAIYRPFRWTAGRYRFVSESSADLTDGRIGPLGAEAVLMEGIRRVDEWPAILRDVPSMTLVFKVESPAGTRDPKHVEADAAAVLDLVDGRRTVQELVDGSGLGEFAAMRTLAGLVEAGAIIPTGPVPAAPAEGVPAARGAPGLPARVPEGESPWIPRLAWGVAIVWLLASLLVFQVDPSGLLPLSPTRVRSLDRVRSLRARADLAELARRVEEYALTRGELPANVGALGTFGKPSRDPWGHPYQIQSSGPRTAGGAGVSVLSGGPDGRIGTPDDIILADR